ncbi:MAG: hypothetical protein IPN71_19520 [Fibrobacteres bacterium]|jgi:hypothetical protein|nr:hypothetical protein [Fibrobacterota bacterium]
MHTLKIPRALSLFVLSVATSASAIHFRCFEAEGVKAPIQMKFTFPMYDHQPGMVTYRNGKGSIEVEKVSERADESVSNRPVLITTVWKETVPGGKGGRYEMDMQGAVVYRMQYRRSDGKKFDFQEVDEVHGDAGCEWK